MKYVFLVTLCTLKGRLYLEIYFYFRGGLFFFHAWSFHMEIACAGFI